jgi:hypothetical protein
MNIWKRFQMPAHRRKDTAEEEKVNKRIEAKLKVIAADTPLIRPISCSRSMASNGIRLRPTCRSRRSMSRGASPQDRIVRREIAEAVANAAQGFEGALVVRVEDKRQGPPKLHDLPSLQKLCGSRFG